MTYEAAPATELLATSCAICSRPLLDAVSVEVGIGPVCREKHGYAEVGEEHRDEANRIVHGIAARPGDEAGRAAGCDRLREMGFAKLADRVEFRGKDAPKMAPILVEEYTLPAWNNYPARQGYLVTAPYKPSAVEAWRGVRGRVFVKERKANFVPSSSVAELRALLRAHHSGETCVGPSGTTVIGRAA